MLISFDAITDMQNFVEELSHDEADYAVDWGDMEVEVDIDHVKEMASDPPFLAEWLSSTYNAKVEDYDG